MTRRIPFIAVLALVAACDDPSPPLLATNIMVTAPLPGRSNSAAYLTIHNNSSSDVQLQRFSSPQFATIEMHETVVNDGIARMQELDTVAVPSRSAVEFAAGGKHLMLIEPRQGLIPGKPIVIEIHYDDGGLLIVEAPLRSRKPESAND